MIRVQARKSGQAEILIYDPIGANWFGDGFTAKRFVKDLEDLGDIKDILVRINSPGGEVFDGFAIYNALKNHPAQIHVQIDGLAASIASVIAMAGDLVTMGTGAMIMIHDPWSLAVGDSKDMRGVAEMLDQVKEGIIDAYAGRTGIDRAELATLMEAETWFTVDEALKNGFADERIGATELAAQPASTDRFNWATAMAMYSNKPKSFNTPQDSAVSPQSAPAGAMPKEAIMTTPAPASVQDADNIRKDAEKSALAAETARRADIRNAFGRYAEANRELLDTCLDDMSCTVQSAQSKLLAKLAEGSEPLRGPGIVPGADSRDKFIDGVSNAILARGGKVTLAVGNEFAGIRLSGICRAVLNRAGVDNASRLEGSALAAKVFATMSTSDFPLLLSNTANKALRVAYDAAPSTWQTWAARGEVSDFKSNSRIQLGSFNSLAVIPEGGEYQAAGMSEEAETIQAQTKGRFISLTRQMIVNDDLGAFMSRAARLGFAARRTVNEDVYAKLAANGNMSDGGALFNATATTTTGGHANLTSSGTAIAVASIGIGENMIAVQKDKDLRTTLNLVPAYILVPRGKKITAWEILNSPTDPASSNSNKRNYAASLALEIVSDAELDKASATAWYLVSNPNIAPVIEVDFLDGMDVPYTEEQVDFYTDAVLLKVRMDYGVAAIDWRGGYKNAGA